MSQAVDVSARSASICNLMLSLAQSLVEDQDSVSIELTTDANGTTGILLRVAATDLGKVIGQQGRTVRSLRTILQAASMNHQQRYSLDVEAVT